MSVKTTPVINKQQMDMSTSKNRRLAAIFFADIVDYSATMQRNEAEGLLMVRHYRDTLKQKVEEHRGEIMQHYGDGSLVLFSSGIAALQCAKELQEIFRTAPKVPLRIGIHIGDIVVNGKDIYGDGVNVAARIESLSIAGGVLFTQRLIPDLKSHPAFQSTALGRFALKNIDEPVSIFALSNKEFPVPTRKELLSKLNGIDPRTSRWRKALLATTTLLILVGLSFVYFLSKNFTSNSPLSKEMQKKRVAVMVFDNQTTNKKLESFGIMASDWLTQGFMELPEVELANAANVFDNLALTRAGISSFTKTTKAEVLIQGRYYEKGDSLVIYCNITEVGSGKVLHSLDPIQGHKEEAMKLLNELTQRILGYWTLSENRKYNKKIPKYEAYQASIEANQYFYTDTKKVEDYLLKAHSLDTTFMAPLIKLAKYYSIRGRAALCDSLLGVVKQKNTPLTSFEQLRMEAISARMAGQFEKSAAINLQIAQNYDPAYYNNVIGRYLAANNIQKAREIVPLIKDFKDISNIGIRQEGRLARPLFTHFSMGEYSAVLAIMDTVFRHENNVIKVNKIPDLHLRALLQLGKMEAAARYLKFYLDKQNPKVNYSNRTSHKTILRWFCYELYRLNQEVAPPYQELLRQNKMYFELYLIQEDFPKLLPIALKKLEKHPTSKYWMAIIGRLYALQGQEEMAKKMIQKINTTPETYKKGDNAYAEAVIQTALGNKEKAVYLLQKAYKKGFGFSLRTYQYDPSLKSLTTYPPFQEFIQPK